MIDFKLTKKWIRDGNVKYFLFEYWRLHEWFFYWLFKLSLVYALPASKNKKLCGLFVFFYWWTCLKSTKSKCMHDEWRILRRIKSSRDLDKKGFFYKCSLCKFLLRISWYTYEANSINILTARTKLVLRQFLTYFWEALYFRSLPNQMYFSNFGH